MLHVPDYAPLGAAVLGASLLIGAVTQGRARWLVWLALVAAIGVILWLTLALSFGDAGGTGLNLRPLHEIRRLLDSPGGRQYLNVFGNIAMFVPIGALVAWLSRRLRVLAATSVGLLLSVGIEATQLGLGRVGDVDDVILNTTGALLGAALAVAWGAAARRWRRPDYDGHRGL